MRSKFDNKFESIDKESFLNTYISHFKAMLFSIIHSMLKCYSISLFQYIIITVIGFMQLCAFAFSEDVFFYYLHTKNNKG